MGDDTINPMDFSYRLAKLKEEAEAIGLDLSIVQPKETSSSEVEMFGIWLGPIDFLEQMHYLLEIIKLIDASKFPKLQEAIEALQLLPNIAVVNYEEDELAKLLLEDDDGTPTLN